jgi:hypothetical protein
MDTQNSYCGMNFSGNKFTNDLDGQNISKIMNPGYFIPNFTNNDNNNSQIFLPAGNVCNHFYNYDRTYFNDKFNNNINLNKLRNIHKNYEQSVGNINEIGLESCSETQDEVYKNTVEANMFKLPTTESKCRAIKPTKTNTNCPHPDARHYAKVKSF